MDSSGLDTFGAYFGAFMIRFILTGLIIGWIPALIASRKGRNFFGWWVYGTSLFLFALIHAITLKPAGEEASAPAMVASAAPRSQLFPHPDTWRCPCGEVNIAMATECRVCDRKLA
ncbi:MAG: hypothetical protein GF355_08915 [Candidatus Eisenbacteria bacterium]|nr:hypothetical protein [Candidatus Eisenbacteria bacterium]